MTIGAEIARARDAGLPIRVHTRDGEVVVARIIGWDGERLIYAAVTSSRPERYGVCDSTGFSLRRDEIVRVQPLSAKSRERRG